MSLKHSHAASSREAGERWQPVTAGPDYNPLFTKHMLLSIVLAAVIHALCVWWLIGQTNRHHDIDLFHETTTRVQVSVQLQPDVTDAKQAPTKPAPSASQPEVLATEQGIRSVEHGIKKASPIAEIKSKPVPEIKPPTQSKRSLVKKLVVHKPKTERTFKNQQTSPTENKPFVAPQQTLEGDNIQNTNNSTKTIAKQAIAGSKSVGEINCKISQPSYPRIARRKGLEGEVRLRVSLAADGHVTQVAIQKSSGDEEMDNAAVDAVKQANCQPWMEGGQAIPVTAIQSIYFKLNM